MTTGTAVGETLTTPSRLVRFGHTVQRHAEHARRGVPPLRGLLPLAAALVAWQLVVRGQSAYYPRPSLWWDRTVQLWNAGQLEPAIVATVKTFLYSLALATAIGTLLGILIGRVEALDRVLGPFLNFCRVMPAATIVPLAVLFAGYTENMKVAVVVFIGIWPILLQVRLGTRTLNRILLDTARSLRLGRIATARKVLFPSLLPSILLGVRVAAPTVLIIVLLVEIMTAVPGVGALISRSQQNFDSAAAYGLVCIAGILGLLVNAVIAMLEGYLLRYRPDPDRD
jgi:ABC-type nitrate/sulfonate/bicarbonate transport system permease component